MGEKVGWAAAFPAAACGEGQADSGGENSRGAPGTDHGVILAAAFRGVKACPEGLLLCGRRPL